MAMAAARFAARRLASLHQPSKFSSKLLHRGDSPAYALRRFVSSEASAAKHTSVSGDSRLMAAHQKKEELFDLLTEIQMNKEIPYTVRMKDRRLLQHLSKRIDGRPSNHEWRRSSRDYTINSCIRGVAKLLAILYVYEKCCLYFDQNKQVQGADTDSNSKASISCVEPITEE